MFLDKCPLLNGHVNGYVWGQSKLRSEVPITNEKERQTYFGALNYQSQEFPVQSYPSGHVPSTVKFIKDLQNKYKEQRIISIRDGATYHTLAESRDFLSEVNREQKPDNWSITCILFDRPRSPTESR
ncbi:transposase [Microcoleus sp. ARI1-B5]|uniref:transposase n=1 Tax=unclassified Microcoleus TaxID=2642155 RepID=UPI002FD665BA